MSKYAGKKGKRVNHCRNNKTYLLTESRFPAKMKDFQESEILEIVNRFFAQKGIEMMNIAL